MIILVTGTPGTGKTMIGRQLASYYGIKCYNVHEEALRLGLVSGRDEDRNADIISEDDVDNIVLDNTGNEDSFVLEGLLAHHATPRDNMICIVLKCDITVLSERLFNRGYDERKVRENVDSEIFCIIESEAIREGHNIIVFDNSNPIVLSDLIRLIDNRL